MNREKEPTECTIPCSAVLSFVVCRLHEQCCFEKGRFFLVRSTVVRGEGGLERLPAERTAKATAAFEPPSGSRCSMGRGGHRFNPLVPNPTPSTPAPGTGGTVLEGYYTGVVLVVIAPRDRELIKKNCRYPCVGYIAVQQQ